MWLLLSEAMETIESGERWSKSVWLAASLKDALDNVEREWAEYLLASGQLSHGLVAAAQQFIDSAAP
jgi:hypothetical protein